MLLSIATCTTNMMTTTTKTIGGGTHTRWHDADHTQEEQDAANTLLSMASQEKKREKWLHYAKQKNGAILIFITKTKAFQDQNYAHDITHRNFIWEGQRKMKHFDEKVKQHDLILVLFRKATNEPYMFVGRVVRKEVLQERTDNVPIRFKFKVSLKPDILPYWTEIPFYDYKAYNDKQATKSKKNCFDMLGMTVKKHNWPSGIMFGY